MSVSSPLLVGRVLEWGLGLLKGGVELVPSPFPSGDGREIKPGSSYAEWNWYHSYASEGWASPWVPRVVLSCCAFARLLVCLESKGFGSNEQSRKMARLFP